MRFILILFLSITMGACQFDAIKQKSMVGTYKVNIDLDQAKSDEINQALKESKAEIEKAKAELKQELGDNEALSGGLGSIVEGVAKIATGAASLGIGIAESVLKMVNVEITLNENGTVSYHSNSDVDLNFSSKANRWGIDGGKFCFYDEEGKISQQFDLEAISSTEFHLKNKDVTLILHKIK
jgi:hypothetical protein